MPFKITTDPKTGAERAEWVDEAKPAKQQQQTTSAPGSGLADVLTKDGPTLLNSTVRGVAKGFQEFQRSGDLLKAAGAYQGEYIRGLEQSSNPVPRVVFSGARNLVQNVLGNAPADYLSGMTGQPRMQKAGDARILGVLPALPDIKLQGPGEQAASEVVQGLLAWIPAARAVNVGVKALSLLPGARVAAQAGGTAAAFMKGSRVGAAALKAGEIATSGAATGAVVDLVAMDADRTRLTDQVAQWVDKQKGTPWYDPLVEMLRSKPGDTAADARWKNAIESTVFLGPAVGGLLYAGGRAAKAVLRSVKGAATPAAEQVVDATAQAVDDAAKATAKPENIPNPPPKPAAPNNVQTYASMRPTPMWEKKGTEFQLDLEGKNKLPDPWDNNVTAEVQNLETQAAKLAYTTPEPLPTAPGQMRDLVPPTPTQVAEIDPQTIAVDPQRFQFKEAGRLTKSGASGSLSGSSGYNPTLGGIISVWKDPADGVTYVVNGHNRLRLAKESGYGNVLVRYLDAKTAEEARAIGALQNISEGQGTPWDAAKFMRDTNTTVDGMAAQGIDLAGPVAEKAIPLTRLPRELFDRGVQGKLDLAKAVALGSEPLDEAVIRDVALKAGKGRWSAEKITQAMQEAKFAGTQGPDGGVLPGFEEMFKTSNFSQLLDVRVAAFRALREEMVALTSAANARRTGYLEKAGNIINVAGSREAKEAAAQSVAVFNKVTGYKGPVRDLLNELAGQVTAKRPAKQLVEENLPRLRQAIEEEINGPRLPLEEAAAPAARAAQPEPAAPRAEVPAAAAPEPAPVKLYRGTQAGSEGRATVGDAFFMSPDRKVAEAYAGEGGTVTEQSVAFRNLLEAPTWMKAKEQLGLQKSATMDDLIRAARDAGYDGLSFTTKNGKEYVQIPGAAAAPLPLNVEPPAPRAEVPAAAAPEPAQVATAGSGPAAVTDEAIKKLESAYPFRYTSRRVESPLDIAGRRLAEVERLLQGTQEQIQQLRANPPAASASAGVTAKNQRSWDRNLAKFINQEAQVKQDLVVAQAAVDRLTAAAPLPLNVEPPAPRVAVQPMGNVAAAAIEPPAKATAQEIRDLDALLASARADLPAAKRVELRNQLLEQKYGAGSPPEPPAPPAAAAADAAPEGTVAANDLPPVPPEPPVPPVPAPSAFDDPNWVPKYAQAVADNLDDLKSGVVNYEDLTRSTYQQLESPSGSKVYVARQEPLAAGYDAMSEVLPGRAETTGMPSFTTPELQEMSKEWFARYGEDGEAILQGIMPLIRGFEDYQLGALHRAMVLADKQNAEAAIEGAKWINAQFSNVADQRERLAQLIQKAEAARRINDAIRKVTRRWGQIGAEQQLPRDGYDIGPATGRAPQVDIEAQIRNELEQTERVPVQEALTDKLSRELSEATLGGELTPEAVAAADELAKSVVLMGEVPAMRNKFWDAYSKFVGGPGAPSGPLGWIQLLRTNNLISSGVTLATNFMNGLLNMPLLTLEQSLGHAVQGQGKDAAQALKMFEAFWLYKSSAMRTAALTFKAGRPLVDMEASSIDWLARQAAKDAQGELMTKAGADSGWTITTMGVSPQWLESTPGKIANTLWQTFGTGMSRLSITADAFNASLAGQGYEFVRNIDRGMELAVQQGLKEYSPEAWKFAHKYADERVQAMLKDVLLPNGQTFADVAVTGPEARNFMRAITFTDDVVAQLEPRSLTEGMRLGQAQGLKDQKLIDFAERYVKEGNWQHRAADFMLNGSVPIGRIGSMPGMAMEVLAATPVVGPVFRFIQPFIRVPNNIIKSVARRTPGANLLVDTWWRDIVSEDPGTRARAVGGLVTGGAFLTGITMLSQAGKIRVNGGGPQHPQGKLQWELERRDPYSIQVWDDENERWGDSISLRMFEPYTTLMGAIGDYIDIAGSIPAESANRLGGALVMTVGKMASSNLLSKTYFQGFNEAYEALFGTNINVAQLGNINQRDRLSRFASRLVASLVPESSMLREARRGVDPIARSVMPSEVEGLMGFFYETLDEIKNAIPGFSKDIPPRMNWVTNTPVILSGIWGTEAIPPDMDFMVGMAQFAPWSPVKKRAAMTDPISLEMAKLSASGSTFSGPAASDFGSQMRLTQAELNSYINAFHEEKDANGRTWRDAVQELINSEQYKSWPYDPPSTDKVSLRASSIQALVSQFKELAKRRFYATTSKGAAIQERQQMLEGDKREKENLRRYGGATTDPRAFVEELNR